MVAHTTLLETPCHGSYGIVFEVKKKKTYFKTCADPEGEQRLRTPLKNHKAIGFLSNNDPDPFENYKATKPAFIVGPLSARQRNTILIAFCWWADDVPLLVVFGCSLPSPTKKVVKSRAGSPLAKFSGSAHACYAYLDK